MTAGAGPPTGRSPALSIDVVELNEHAPRPFAFTEAALCLRDSIRAMGLGSEHRVNIANPEGVSIVVGALPPLLGPLEQLDPRKTLVFNFEQLASPAALVDAAYLRWLGRWLVLDYHSRNVEFLRQANGGAQQVLELPVVPSPSLAFPPGLSTAKTVDVLFFGTPNERRSALLHQLEQQGLRVELVAGAYAQELAPAVARARLVLHAHYHETGLFPVTRVLQPVANGVPVVCENSVFSAHSDWSRSGILFAPYEGLVDACRALLASPDEQRARAGQARRFAAQLDFSGPFQVVLQALAARLAAPRRPAPPPPPRPIAAPRPIDEPRAMGPPASIEPPRTLEAPRPAAARATDAEGGALSTEEIEAILAQEAQGLPREAHLEPPPLALSQRQPGQTRFGRWIVWLLIVFTLASLIQAMR